MATALIGNTGFVGSNLLRTKYFTHLFNSTNINQIVNHDFSEVVCAGVSAVKWQANLYPEKDFENINKLIGFLKKVSADRFVLISTIDVNSERIGIDESASSSLAHLDYYGRHRLLLEDFVRSQFENYSIIRLPALFGPGLKKNVIFDLIKNNQADKIAPNSVYQWYPIECLAHDLDCITMSQIKLINITSKPIETQLIHNLFFKKLAIGNSVLNPIRYDIRSQYDSALGGIDGYHYSESEILNYLENYLLSELIVF
jgi:hypothetical protein